MKEITGIRISASTLSQRAQAIGWELLHEALGMALRPMADPARHPGAFHRGLRLLAIDGTTFNLRNTPAIGERAVKPLRQRQWPAGLRAAAGGGAC